MRAALILDETVYNVIEYNPENIFDPSPYQLVVLSDDQFVDIGWRYDGTTFYAVEHKLEASPEQIVANSTDVATVTYTNTFSDAPKEVIFDVNGAQTTIPLTDGVAQLEIVAQYPGDILVTVDDLSVTITATEV